MGKDASQDATKSKDAPPRKGPYQTAVVLMTALAAAAAGANQELLTRCLLAPVIALLGLVPGGELVLAVTLLSSWPMRAGSAVAFAGIQYGILFRPLALYGRRPRRWLLWVQAVLVLLYALGAAAYGLWMGEP